MYYQCKNERNPLHNVQLPYCVKFNKASDASISLNTKLLINEWKQNTLYAHVQCTSKLLIILLPVVDHGIKNVQDFINFELPYINRQGIKILICVYIFKNFFLL